MSDRSTTRERILEVSRHLFNEKGFAATRLAEIAAGVGIATGNLTYHFPTKLSLVAALEKRARQGARAKLSRKRHGAIADVYVDLLLVGMKQLWENRFLFRDYEQFRGDPNELRLDPDMTAELEEGTQLLQIMQKEGLFRRDMPVDLSVLARTLMVVTRYWMDYLREFEGLKRVTLADQERGIHSHFTILLPYLTASAKRDLESALLRASTRLAILEEETQEEGTER